MYNVLIKRKDYFLPAYLKSVNNNWANFSSLRYNNGDIKFLKKIGAKNISLVNSKKNLTFSIRKDIIDKSMEFDTLDKNIIPDDIKKFLNI